MRFDDGYDSIIALARSVNFKKIMIMRNTWSKGNWGIVNKIYIKDNIDEIYCKNVEGFIQYANGNKHKGSFPCFNTYAWRIVKVLDEQDIEIIYPVKDENK
jgi:hypothetical protein